MLEHQKNRRRAEKQANERLEFDRQVERRREREFERREYPSSSSNTQRFVPINSTPEGAELKGNMLRKGYTEKQINDHFSSIDWQIQMGMGVSSVQAYHLNYIRFNYPKNKDSLTVKIFKIFISFWFSLFNTACFFVVTNSILFCVFILNDKFTNIGVFLVLSLTLIVTYWTYKIYHIIGFIKSLAVHIGIFCLLIVLHTFVLNKITNNIC